MCMRYFVASPECAAVTQQMKRFAEFNQGSMMECCSVFPAVQDLLANLTIPMEGQPQPHMMSSMGSGGPGSVGSQVSGGQMVRPPMGQPMMNVGGGPGPSYPPQSYS